MLKVNNAKLNKIFLFRKIYHNDMLNDMLNLLESLFVGHSSMKKKRNIR